MQEKYSTICLGLEEFKVIDMTDVGEFIIIRVIKRSNQERCQKCGRLTDKIHDRRYQSVLDMPVCGKQLVLRVMKRRFRCFECHHVFLEPYASINRYSRLTERLAESVFKESILPFTVVGKRFEISDNIVARIFNRRAKEEVSNRICEPVAVLGIDENSFKKRHKYNMVLTDLGRQKLLEILPGRRRETVIEWLKSFQYKNLIRYVVIDLYKPFELAVKSVCPDVVVIADRFHLVQNLNRLLCSVKRTLTEQTGFKWPRGLRWLLMKSREELSVSESEKLDKALDCCPPLAVAYALKEAFRAIYKANSYEEGEERLIEWMYAAAQSSLPGFQRFVKTLRRWHRQILNWFEFNITNGYTEGLNNKLKLIKRQAYGFRRFETFRLKALLSCNKVA